MARCKSQKVYVEGTWIRRQTGGWVFFRVILNWKIVFFGGMVPILVQRLTRGVITDESYHECDARESSFIGTTHVVTNQFVAGLTGQGTCDLR